MIPFKLLLLSALILSNFLVSPAISAVYCVKKSGSDSKSGTVPGVDCSACSKDDSNAWSSVSKINSTVFSPGDSICFKCGETWQQALNVNSSGTKDKPITYGAYGSCTKEPNCPGSSQYGTCTTQHDSYPCFSPLGVSFAVRVSEKEHVILQNLKASAPAIDSSSRAFLIQKTNNITLKYFKATNHSNQNGEVVRVSDSKNFLVSNGVLDGGNYGFAGFASASGMLTGTAEHLKITNPIYGSSDEHDGMKCSKGDVTGLVYQYNDISRWIEDGIDSLNCTGLVIQYNYIHDSLKDRAGDVDGIKLCSNGNGKCIAKGNIFRNISNRLGDGGSCIEVGISIGNIITSNVCIKPAEHGITVAGARDPKILWNTIIDAGVDGIRLNSVTNGILANNVVDGGTAGDILIQSSNSTASGWFNFLVNSDKPKILDNAFYINTDLGNL